MVQVASQIGGPYRCDSVGRRSRRQPKPARDFARQQANIRHHSVKRLSCSPACQPRSGVCVDLP